MMMPQSQSEGLNLPPPLVPVDKLCRPFSLAEILSATHNFDDSLVIGKGGFGQVYKGVFDDGANVVAIKRLNSTSKQGCSEFRNEIEMLSKFRHSHIVTLIGYCYSSSEMILVYEYMSNGSLADHLYKIRNNGSIGCTLSWVERLKICLGAARGLDYLHTGTCTVVEDGVIHRDVKSSNILLDDRWVARLSDFGLSKTNPINQSHALTKVRGTAGYMDPEYALTYKLRKKSDVYSFGIVLFEVLCGGRVRDLTLEEEQQGLEGWVSHYIFEGRLHQIIDPNLRWEIFPNSLTKFVEIANQCLCYYSKRRPTMTQVVASLELALTLQQRNDSSVLAMEIFENVDNVDSTIVQEEDIKFHDCVKPTQRNAFRKLLQPLSLFVPWKASGRKQAKLKRTCQQFDANQDSDLNKEQILVNIEEISVNIEEIFDTNRDNSLNKEELASIDNKFGKADIIFRHFDTNQDNCLSPEEMRALAVAVYPEVKFTNEHLNSLLIKFFQTYSSDIDQGKGLTFAGFLQMYDDGVRNVDRDFATLFLALNSRIRG